MIIDVHGHYTTAPKALENWRNQQIAGIADAAKMPKVADLKISDDELRESIEAGTLPATVPRLLAERRRLAPAATSSASSTTRQGGGGAPTSCARAAAMIVSRSRRIATRLSSQSTRIEPSAPAC